MLGKCRPSIVDAGLTIARINQHPYKPQHLFNISAENLIQSQTEAKSIQLDRKTVNMIRLTNVGFTLGQRRRQWANIKPTLFLGIMLSGKKLLVYSGSTRQPPRQKLSTSIQRLPKPPQATDPTLTSIQLNRKATLSFSYLHNCFLHNCFFNVPVCSNYVTSNRVHTI